MGDDFDAGGIGLLSARRPAAQSSYANHEKEELARLRRNIREREEELERKERKKKNKDQELARRWKQHKDELRVAEKEEREDRLARLQDEHLKVEKAAERRERMLQQASVRTAEATRAAALRPFGEREHSHDGTRSTTDGAEGGPFDVNVERDPGSLDTTDPRRLEQDRITEDRTTEVGKRSTAVSSGKVEESGGLATGGASGGLEAAAASSDNNTAVVLKKPGQRRKKKRDDDDGGEPSVVQDMHNKLRQKLGFHFLVDALYKAKTQNELLLITKPPNPPLEPEPAAAAQDTSGGGGGGRATPRNASIGSKQSPRDGDDSKQDGQRPMASQRAQAMRYRYRRMQQVAGQVLQCRKQMADSFAVNSSGLEDNDRGKMPSAPSAASEFVNNAYSGYNCSRNKKFQSALQPLAPRDGSSLTPSRAFSPSSAVSPRSGKQPVMTWVTGQLWIKGDQGDAKEKDNWSKRKFQLTSDGCLMYEQPMLDEDDVKLFDGLPITMVKILPPPPGTAVAFKHAWIMELRDEEKNLMFDRVWLAADTHELKVGWLQAFEAAGKADDGDGAAKPLLKPLNVIRGWAPRCHSTSKTKHVAF